MVERLQNKKKSRKANPGGKIRWINLPRNWLHQAISYMDKGEVLSRIVIELIEFSIVSILINAVMNNLLASTIIGFIIVHTWNWVTNCLFWAIIIFAFPNLKNPGAEKTQKYLNDMKNRLLKSESVSGLAIYGSVSRGAWHERSDIDIRILRKNGFLNLIDSVFVTMRERFIALIYKQPMDLYLADNIEFLKNMRSDEVPLLLIKKDPALNDLYPDNNEQDLEMRHFVR